jgi:hypothetical protein
LLTAARAAFIKGVQLGAAISTAGAVVLAVVAGVSLRHVAVSKA